MYFTRQIKKKVLFIFFILKQTPLYGGLGLRSIIPHQVKFFGHQKSTNIWLLDLHIFQKNIRHFNFQDLVLAKWNENLIGSSKLYTTNSDLSRNYLLPFHFLQFNEVVRWNGRLNVKPLPDFAPQKMLCVENDHVVEN